MNGLKDDYRGDVYFTAVDVDSPANAELSSLYNVRSIPTIVVLDDRGAVVRRFVGLTQAGDLRAAFQQALTASAAS